MKTLTQSLLILSLAACGGGGDESKTPSPTPIANSAPVAYAGTDQNQSTGSLITLDGSASSDADGDVLIYTWSLIAPESSLSILSNGNTSKPSFTPDIEGSYTITLTVNDGTIDSQPDVIVIAAENANSAPVAHAGKDQNQSTGSLVTLDGSASSDADEDTLIYSWSLTTIPTGSGALLIDSTNVAPTFTADIDGTYIAQLIVNDGQSDSAPNNVTIVAKLPIRLTSLDVTIWSGGTHYTPYTDDTKDGEECHIRPVDTTLGNIRETVIFSSVDSCTDLQDMESEAALEPLVPFDWSKATTIEHYNEHANYQAFTARIEVGDAEEPNTFKNIKQIEHSVATKGENVSWNRITYRSTTGYLNGNGEITMYYHYSPDEDSFYFTSKSTNGQIWRIECNPEEYGGDVNDFRCVEKDGNNEYFLDGEDMPTPESKTQDFSLVMYNYLVTVMGL